MSVGPSRERHGWLARTLFGASLRSTEGLREEVGRLAERSGELAKRCAALERQRDETVAAIERLQASDRAMSAQLQGDAAGALAIADRLGALEEQVRTGGIDVEKVRLQLAVLAEQVTAEAENTRKIAAALYERIALVRQIPAKPTEPPRESAVRSTA